MDPVLACQSAFSIGNGLYDLYTAMQQAPEDLDDVTRCLDNRMFKAKTLWHEVKINSEGLSSDEMSRLDKDFADLKECIEVTTAKLPAKRGGRYRLRDRVWYICNQKSVKRDLERFKGRWENFDPSWLLEREDRSRTRELHDWMQQARRGRSPMREIDFVQIGKVDSLIDQKKTKKMLLAFFQAHNS